MRRGGRAGVLIVLVVIGGLAGLLGPGSSGAPELLAGSATRPVMPVADEPGVLSSAWYCAAGAADGGVADVTLVVANPLDDARRGTITWFTDDGRESEAIQVAGKDSLTLAASDVVEGSWASAVVEIEGGGVAVEHRLTGSAGTTVSPCASGPSDEWHFANGSTAQEARQRLYLFNPFPDDVVVDMTFAAGGPPEMPADLQGLAIEPRSTVVVEVGEHVLREDVTSATVRARSGRLVVDRVQFFTEEAEQDGISLAVGAPSPAPVWHVARGWTGDGVTQRWHVYNPGDDEAIVLLEVAPDEGPVPESVERTIRPGASVVVVAADIPLLEGDDGFSATVRTINDVPVVVEREIDAREPAELRGWTSHLASPLTARRWAVPAGLASDTVERSIVVANPSAQPVTASVEVFGDGALAEAGGGETIQLGPAERAEVEIEGGDGDRPVSVLVRADAPMVVERHLSWPDGAGLDVSPGIPLR